jgi:hypothetical protein
MSGNGNQKRLGSRKVIMKQQIDGRYPRGMEHGCNSCLAFLFSWEKPSQS